MNDRSLPLPPVSTLTPLVVVAPHPDDETLGCGGLLARCAAQNVQVQVVALTDGEASHPASTNWPRARIAAVRRAEQRRALATLGHRRATIHRLGLPDGGVLRLEPNVRRAVVLRLRLVLAGCGAVFVTALDDEHPDHAAAAALVHDAMKGQPGRTFYYAVWPPNEDPPRLRETEIQRWHLALGAERQRKRQALAMFRSQRGECIDDDPHGFRMPPELLERATASMEWYSTLERAAVEQPW